MNYVMAKSAMVRLSTTTLTLCFAAVIVASQFWIAPARAQDAYYPNRYYWNHYWYWRYHHKTPPTKALPTTSTNNSGDQSGDNGDSDQGSGDTGNGGDVTTPVVTAPITTPPITPPAVVSAPPAAGMALTFNDDFDVLSTSSSGMGTIWQTKFWYNSLTHSNWLNLDLDPAACGLGLTPYRINNGILTIHEQPTDPRLLACGVAHPYTSGNLYSYYSFYQQYGYFEIRMRASGVYGTTSTFWMLPRDGSWPPEIDMPEILGREPNIDHLSNHTGPNNTTITFPVNAGVNLANDFHKYGVLWDSSTITYYLDDRIVAQTPTQADEHKPFYLILGLGVGTCGSWIDCPRSPATFSADSYIDYVRAWQFNNQSPRPCVGNC